MGRPTARVSPQASLPGGGDLSAPDINSLGSALAEETSSVVCGASLCAAWWCSNEGFPVAFQEEEH